MRRRTKRAKTNSGVIAAANVYGKKFGSITEFNDYLEAGTIQPAFESWPASIHGDWEWTNTQNYDEATTLLLHGDPDAKRRIEDRGVRVTIDNIKHTEKKRTTYLAPCGFAPHVPNALAGRPNSMIAERKMLQRKRVLTVCYNIAALGDADANEMQQTAANVLSAILRLESSGIRVNLWAVAISSSGADYVTTAVRIKDSFQHADILKMAYPMTHPSMFRRHVFRFREVLPGLPSKFGGFYGCTCSDNNEMQQCVRHLGIQADAVLGFYQCKDLTVEQIIDEINEVNR